MQLKHRPHFSLRRWQIRRILRRRKIFRQISIRYPRVPRLSPDTHSRDVITLHAIFAEQRRKRRIVKRPQHPRHILQRRTLYSTLFNRSRWLALKVDDNEVVFRPQHLPEVVVAMNSSSHRTNRLAQRDIESRRNLTLTLSQSFSPPSPFVRQAFDF